MKIFLFVIEGKPGFRTDLHQAQAVLEDHLRDQRDVSDVWWDDERPHEARKYLYGSSHVDTAVEDDEVDYETTDQLIWPVEVQGLPEQMMDPTGPGWVEMNLSVKTLGGLHQMTRHVSQAEWDEERLRPHLVTSFAVRAGQTIADLWNPKETT